MKARVLLVAAALRGINTYPHALPILFNAARLIWHLLRRRLRKLQATGQMPSLDPKRSSAHNTSILHGMKRPACSYAAFFRGNNHNADRDQHLPLRGQTDSFILRAPWVSGCTTRSLNRRHCGARELRVDIPEPEGRESATAFKCIPFDTDLGARVLTGSYIWNVSPPVGRQDSLARV
ncbi:hypothetical protein C8Q70DRAFT_411337 [Cubamyces menziesii]|nr:hypothetical protein C8Q70DRAFT_411337 [Cubamyces menziesii]